ncbi:MAG: glycerophosphodiester phosphodiesterase [Acetobacter sp.]|nr:glycerophosphodiester phosphodiesterase [Bacteroides sp.]MCM1341263.1 glycerophosphodiester phosphodiesterase [Acetobacter sp.]MCM1433960.1 glycerophosphodiester phosphodiesterase [Clostridiales bacterium]
MTDKVSKWVKFKRFLKRNMTPTWAKHISYQIFAFLVSVAMIIGVADYALTKTYDEMELTFVEGFTITAHTGAYDTAMNSVEFVETAVSKSIEVIELDIRQRPNGTVVMSHDLVVTNNDGVDLKEAFELLKDTNIRINLDIKETKALNNLYKLLKEYNLAEQSFLTGIEVINVKAVKESDCAEMDYYLNYMPSRTKVFFDEYRQKLIELLDETGAVGINCNYKFASSQLSSLLHKKGYKLSIWTVDTKRKAKKVLVCKPDNITTRNPDLIQEVINNWGK